MFLGAAALGDTCIATTTIYLVRGGLLLNSDVLLTLERASFFAVQINDLNKSAAWCQGS